MSPFKDDFLYVADVPWRVAQKLVHGLNRRGAEHNEQPGAQHPAQGAADAVFRTYLGRQLASYWKRLTGQEASDAPDAPPPATSGRPVAASRLEAQLAQLDSAADVDDSLAHLRGRTTLPSLGYVTIDGCPGPADDTQHAPVPFSAEQPDYVMTAPREGVQDTTKVDVVFVDFIERPLLRLLNDDDPDRTYTAADVQVWGNVSTQWLYPTYASLAWQPASMAAAWAEMDQQASREGYPPLAQFDTYEAHPYAPVQAARQDARLVIQ